MAEFSTRSMLDVVVSERSLSNARNKIESEMGRSVRASVDADVSGRGGRGGRRSVTDIFETQTEILVQIRDAIEEGNFDSSGRGGGTTILGGLGLGGAAKAGGLVAAGAGGLGLAEMMKNSTLDSLRQNNPQSFERPDEGPGVPAQIATDPLSILQNVGQGVEQAWQDAGPQFRSTILDAFTDAFSSSGSILERTIRASQIGERIAGGISSTLSSFQLTEPDWLSNLTSFRLTEPQWLSRLTSFRLREPEWVRQLTSVLGGNGGRGGVSGGGPPAGARIPGSEVNVNATVGLDGSDLERAFSRALRTRDVERFIVDTIRAEFNI